MIPNLKVYIPLKWKIKVHLLFFKFRKPKHFLNKISTISNKKRIYIFLAADYGNLGDVAITYAQHKFLKENFPDYVVTEIPISKTIEGIVFAKKIISKDDIITTVGGGNMGDLYPMIELFRQEVIKNFPKNMIVSFPQTIDFNDTSSGQKALKRAVRVYSKHKNLILLAREQKSYDFFNAYFKHNNILLVPDIVLTLDKTKPQKERSGAVICLRNDKEKKLNRTEESKLLKIINTNFKKNITRDTHIGGENLSLLKRVKALHDIWNDFKEAEIVITDRLHGMIFCYITNTPAIVFLNNNHKIQSSYSWIKEAKHIHLMEKFSEKEINDSILSIKIANNKSEIENLVHLYYEFLEMVKV